MNINVRGHEFISVPISMQNDSNFIFKLFNSDKICIKCGMIINESNIILLIHNEIQRNGMSVFNYELSCDEIIIKNLLE